MSTLPIPPAVHSLNRNDLDRAENMLAHAGLFCNEPALFRTRLAVEVSTALAAVRLLVGAHQTVSKEQARDADRVVTTCLRLFAEQQVENTPLWSALWVARQHVRQVHQRLYAHTPAKVCRLLQRAVDVLEAWDAAAEPSRLTPEQRKTVQEDLQAAVQMLRDQLNA